MRKQLDFEKRTALLVCDKCFREYKTSLVNGLHLKHYCDRCKNPTIVSKIDEKMRKIKQDGLVDRIDFLKTQWLRMKKYKMSSSGDGRLDSEIKKLLGNWL